MVTVHLNVRSRRRIEMVDITDMIKGELESSGVTDGICYVYVPHTTAGVTINEGADPTVRQDILNVLGSLVPHERGYLHREGNSDAHMKASLMGASASVPVEGGKLMLGTWQAIYFCEFDGPRHRRVIVKIMAG